MMWAEVLKRILSVCSADPVLASIYGTKMRLTGTGDHEVPLLEWMLIGDTEEELWAPCIVQFDQWTKTMGDLALSEGQLRRLFHLDLPAEIGGVLMFSQYQDGDSLAVPDRNGYYGRAIRFRISPLRRRYAAPALTD